MRLALFYFFILQCIVLSFSPTAKAGSLAQNYGVSIVTQELNQKNHQFQDSLFNQPFVEAQKHIVYQVFKPIYREKHSLEFYLLLALCIFLGVIRNMRSNFLHDVWRAFTNPSLGNRQLKELIQSATFPNLLLNLFSGIVLGLYVYYLIAAHKDWRFVALPNTLIVGLFIIGALFILSGKYLFIHFFSWTLNKKQSGEQYLFNVFLVYKIMGLMLLPFVIMLAFSAQSLHSGLVISSLILLFLLYLNRNYRSWNIFSPEFQNSIFHFLMYLCAFEILPMAALIKTVSLLLN